MDTNTSAADRKTNKRHCCVPGCNSNDKEPSSLHRFPLRDKNLYLRWLKVLKIHKPSKEMYVCSRHFKESDFFGGWLAVESNKRRLKRGVIPTLQLPKGDFKKRVKALDSQSTLLNNTADFAASLNLLPVKKKATVDRESASNEPGGSKKKLLLDNEKLSTDTDNLLILKRVGEIREAPEFQAKKKYDAQLHTNKLKGIKKLQYKKLAPATGSPRPQSTSPQRPQLTGFQRPQLIGPQHPQLTGPQRSQLTGPERPQLSEFQCPPLTEFQRPQLTEFQRSQLTGSQRPQLTGSQRPQLTGSQSPQLTGSQSSQFQASPSSLKVKPLRELTQAHVKRVQVISRDGNTKNGQRKQIKKVRVLTQAEVESMKKSADPQLKKIRVVTQSELKKYQLASSLAKNGMKRKIINPPVLISNENNASQTEDVDLHKIRQNVHELIKENQDVSNGLVMKQDKFDSHRPKQFDDFMQSSVKYFTTVTEEVNKTSAYRIELNVIGSPFDPSRDVRKVPSSISETVGNLEKVISNLTKGAGWNMNPGVTKGTRNVALQTESNWEMSMKMELEKSKNENKILQNEITSLKNKVAVLEREVLGSRKGQLLYFYPPTS